MLKGLFPLSERNTTLCELFCPSKMNEMSGVFRLSRRLLKPQDSGSVMESLNWRRWRRHLNARTSSLTSTTKCSVTADKNMTLSRSSACMFSSLSPSTSSSPLEICSSFSLTSSATTLSRLKGKKAQKLGRKYKARSSNRPPYKHIPHSLKPPHLVAKRNARERKRVQAVNSAFSRLRKHVPFEPRHRRLSKVKTLRLAIEYIQHLQELIHNHDRQISENNPIHGVSSSIDYQYQQNLSRGQSRPHLARRVSMPQSCGTSTPFPDAYNDVHKELNDTGAKCFPFRNSDTIVTVQSSQSFPLHVTSSNMESLAIENKIPPSPCCHSDGIGDCSLSYSIPFSFPLSDSAFPTHFENVPSTTSSSDVTLDDLAYETPSSKFVSLRESVLYQDSVSNNEVVFLQNIMDISSETRQLTSPASLSTTASVDNGRKDLTSDAVSYNLGFQKPSSSFLIPEVITQDICVSSTSHVEKIKIYSSTATPTIKGYGFETLPQQVRNNCHSFKSTDSQIVLSIAALDERNTCLHFRPVFSPVKTVNLAE